MSRKINNCRGRSRKRGLCGSTNIVNNRHNRRRDEDDCTMQNESLSEQSCASGSGERELSNEAAEASEEREQGNAPTPSTSASRINNEDSNTPKPNWVKFLGKPSWPSYIRQFFKEFYIIPHPTKDILTGNCKLCPSEKPGDNTVRASRAATSNFKRLLESFHKNEFQEFNNNQTGTLGPSSRKPVKIEVDQPMMKIALKGRIQAQLDEKMVSMIVIDNLPLNAINRDGFRSFIKVMYY